jgi:hypothetical protein
VEKEMAMTCSTCGGPLQSDVRFCARCGAPTIDPRFAQAEGAYAQLKGRFDAGQLTADQFKAQLDGLMLEHDGRHWMIGANTGRWYVYDGHTWQEAAPPRATDGGGDGSAGSAPGARRTAASSPPGKKGSFIGGHLTGIVRGLVVAAIVAVGGGWLSNVLFGVGVGGSGAAPPQTARGGDASTSAPAGTAGVPMRAELLGHLPVVDYCQYKALPAPVVTRDTWTCGKDGPVVDLTDACRWWYQSQTAVAQSVTPGGPYATYCFRSDGPIDPQLLGGVFAGTWDAYCAAKGLPVPAQVVARTWTCGAGGPAIDVTDVCRWQYKTTTATAREIRPGNAGTNFCFRS